MLMIHKGDGEKTLVALAKIGEEIEEGEKLLTIAGISSLEGLLLKAESEIILQDSATPPSAKRDMRRRHGDISEQ